MITEKIFCKACGQKIDTSFLSMISGKKFVELDDGYYCQECARDRIKKRRGKMK
jgi:hypothetical protein